MKPLRGNRRRISLLVAAVSLACAPVPPAGESVHISEESAIIVWDAGAKTQHFIRRAEFETKAKDFGFLVPTPSVPQLGEADNEAFSLLERLTAPNVVVREVEGEQPRVAEAPAPASAPAPVVVIATAEVAGYDAAVLEARDAVALNRWLKEHGYASSPELVEWAKPYVERSWKVTAFKIAGSNSQSERTASKAVRMSFATDRPYFPYREPAMPPSAIERTKSRVLRVFLLADARFDASVGATQSWPGKTVWSGPLIESAQKELVERLKLPQGTASKMNWLTELEDPSSPRPGIDDLFFRVAADQSNVKRPDKIVDRYIPRKSPDSDATQPMTFIVGIIGIVAVIFGLTLIGTRR